MNEKSSQDKLIENDTSPLDGLINFLAQVLAEEFLAENNIEIKGGIYEYR